MKKIIFALCLLTTSTVFAQMKLLPSTIGKTVADFTLRGADGQLFSTADKQDVKGFMVVFTCNHCPFAKLYTQRFNDLNAKYAPLGVPFLAINSMDSLIYEEESFEEMQAKTVYDKINFPYLQDALQTVGKDFGANHTPHAFVVWRENGKLVIRYTGAIDDNGEHPEAAKPLIANAVDDLLANRQIQTPETPTFGCAIFYRK